MDEHITSIEEAKNQYLKEAQAGNLAAQTAMGIVYFQHRLYEEAEKWLIPAANKVYDPAMYALALMYTTYPSEQKEKRIQGYTLIGALANKGHEGAIELLNNKEFIEDINELFGSMLSLMAALDSDNPPELLDRISEEVLTDRKKWMGYIAEEADKKLFLSLLKRIEKDANALMEFAEFYERLGMPEYVAEKYIMAVNCNVVGAKEKLDAFKDKYMSMYKAGDFEAGYVIGMTYYYEGEAEKAGKYFEEAYNAGIKISGLGLATLYYFGEGGYEEDIRCARRYIKEAYSVRNDLYLVIIYAYCVMLSEHEKCKNYLLSEQLFLSIADYVSNGTVELALGNLYYHENCRDGNLIQSPMIAKEFYKSAIKKGNMEACVKIVELYAEMLDRYIDEDALDTPECQKMLDDYIKCAKMAFDAKEYDVGISYAGMYIYGLVDRIDIDYSVAWNILKEGIEAGNLMCKLGMLNYALDGALPLMTRFEWLKELIDEVEEEGIDVSEYRVKYQQIWRLKNKKKGCYITTAVCKAEGKPDDCYELQTFRKFRDEWLKNQPDGEALIQEYYAMAPGIVEKIDAMENSDEIYRKIKEEYLWPCLKLIEEERLQECKELYVKMVRDLEQSAEG